MIDFFSRIPVMENFLHLISAQDVDAPFVEWPQMTRAVIDEN